MSSSSPNQDANVSAEVPDEAYVYALEQLMKGQKPGDVRRSLIEAGHAPKVAEKIVQYAVKYRRDHQEDEVSLSENYQRGKRNMLMGGAFFLFGSAATISSIVAASQGGPRIYLAWGAIVFGAIQFFRGLSQSNA